MQAARPHHSQAFTLVELAIVLVLIGLIVGGVMAGRSMIRVTQLNSMITQTAQISTAVNTFRGKYGKVPGELLNYQNFFPLTGSFCPKTSSAISNNFNDLIDDGYEVEAAFAQLYAAGLIETGRPQILQDGTVRTTYDCRENSMQQFAGFKTRLNSDVFAVFNGLLTTGNTGMGIPPGRNSITFGNFSVGTMTVEEGAGFDRKFDDGLPLAGRVIMQDVNDSLSHGWCITVATPGAGYYMASAQMPSCYTNIALP